MQRYFLLLSYDGTAYHGWQIQPNAQSVQEHLEQALSRILQEDIRLTGAGRTDTGVHARQFFAHFNTRKENLQQDRRFIYGLNGILPPDIAAKAVYPVKDHCHARFDAISRSYEYIIARQKDPFYQQYAWLLKGGLEVARMNCAALVLLQYQDFTSFSKLHAEVKTNNCNVSHAEWQSRGDKLVFTITANRFLRNMVRAIVGTLVDVGFGKISPEGFRDIIEAKDRGLASASAPAKGLFLTSVEYPYDLR